MKLNEICKKLNIFFDKKLVNNVESNIEQSIKKTIRENYNFYSDKEYVKPFLKK